MCPDRTVTQVPGMYRSVGHAGSLRRIADPPGRSKHNVAIACMLVFCCTAGLAEDPTPRLRDGHPNLGSAPDKKGYWEIRPGGGGFRPEGPVPFQDWSKALYQYRNSRFSIDSPLVDCKASPGPSFFNAPGFEIVDVPEQKSIFILNIAGPHSWRVIYTDGRPHPKPEDLRPTFLGHSIGRWEGDTLVIDTVGFNEKQWPVGAYPTTDKLHLTERISRPNPKTLNYEATIDDPGAYTKP